MWVFTTRGFYSITVSTDDPTAMQIRARERYDLEALIELVGMDAKILTTPQADYRFRVIVPAHTVGGILLALGNDITYCNFKGAIAKTPDQAHKEPGLHRIWSIHREWQRDGTKAPTHPEFWPWRSAPPTDRELDQRAGADILPDVELDPAPNGDDPGNVPLEPCGRCEHPRDSHNHLTGACLEQREDKSFCTCSRWQRPARKAGLTVTPTTCPHCDYDEAEGGLIEQCANCKAADAGEAAQPLHNPLERRPGRKSRGQLAETIAVEKSGWGDVIGSKVGHYFRNRRSLCGKWQIEESSVPFLKVREPIPNADCKGCVNNLGKSASKF